MRWGVNWQLVTGERKKKSLWSSLLLFLPLFPPHPPTACSHLLAVKSTLSKTGVALFSFFLGVLFEDLCRAGRGCRTSGWGSVSRWGGWEVVRTGLGSHLCRSDEVRCFWTRLIMGSPLPSGPRPHPGPCSDYWSASRPQSSAGSAARLSISEATQVRRHDGGHTNVNSTLMETHDMLHFYLFRCIFK